MNQILLFKVVTPHGVVDIVGNDMRNPCVFFEKSHLNVYTIGKSN